MVEDIRKIKKRRYIFALIFTVAIFVIGIFVSNLVNKERVSYIEKTNIEQRLNYESLQLRQLLLQKFSSRVDYCQYSERTLRENINELSNLGQRLENYKKEDIQNKIEYYMLKREYFLNELRYWLLEDEIRKICGEKSISILYFYSLEGCEQCDTQGEILMYLKNIFKDKILIFSFDYDFVEEPMINIIKDTYNIKKTPALIIEDERFEGLVNKDDLLNIICKKFPTPLDICK